MKYSSLILQEVFNVELRRFHVYKGMTKDISGPDYSKFQFAYNVEFQRRILWLRFFLCFWLHLTS